MSRKSSMKGCGSCGTRISKAPVAATAQQDPQDPWSMKYLVPRLPPNTTLWKDITSLHLDIVLPHHESPWASKESKDCQSPQICLWIICFWFCPAAFQCGSARPNRWTLQTAKSVRTTYFVCCSTTSCSGAIHFRWKSLRIPRTIWKLPTSKGGFKAKRLDFKCRCSSLVESRARSLETQAAAKLFWSMILSKVWYPGNMFFFESLRKILSVRTTLSYLHWSWQIHDSLSPSADSLWLFVATLVLGFRERCSTWTDRLTALWFGVQWSNGFHNPALMPILSLHLCKAYSRCYICCTLFFLDQTSSAEGSKTLKTSTMAQSSAIEGKVENTQYSAMFCRSQTAKTLGLLCFLDMFTLNKSRKIDQWSCCVYVHVYKHSLLQDKKPFIEAKRELVSVPHTFQLHLRQQGKSHGVVGVFVSSQILLA